MPAADFCRTVRVDRSTLSPDSGTCSRPPEIRFDRLQRATAEFTTSALDGYGLRGHLPARPAPYASYPVLVHRLASLLHASFRPRLATTPLRFAITSPPSGCEGDLHPQAVNHARHTKERPVRNAQAFPFAWLAGGNRARGSLLGLLHGGAGGLTGALCCVAGGAGVVGSLMPFRPSLKPLSPSPNPLPSSRRRWLQRARAARQR